ncbi:MAG: hypothetical protein KC561_05280, partial [Myxococcales bacterium]|nr:hypothetical protein [Myxococcales bacterium]
MLALHSAASSNGLDREYDEALALVRASVSDHAAGALTIEDTSAKGTLGYAQEAGGLSEGHTEEEEVIASAISEEVDA